ncbi:DapH/DapD/GlmU-related protein [Clostridium chrysemydis]|uniref:DapH/DapD/GlmU-related protein n=1 Tax=Clostridium chrysemydis TaxID=2665504 RepID=UPI001883C863|nr:DapH/DapD/GlmU-related protein [Clostridium chrysemydis]
MKNSYGISEILKNIFSLIYTKLCFKDARLIRRPVYVRGKKFFSYGKGFTTGYNCRIEIFDTGLGNSKKLIIGENCKIGDYVHIAAGENVIIGDNCLMASKIYISDINHGDYSGEFEYSSPTIPPDSRSLYTKPVKIGNNVWIGENACVLPGVMIGDGCIVGANSIVNKNIPNNSIVAGSPAEIIKKYNFELKKWERINKN